METGPYQSDFLVLGTGIAGLSYALRVADHGSVSVLCKGEATLTNTSWAQGGIAAVWDGADSVEDHVGDTVTAGVSLADLETVSDILQDGPRAVQQLIDWGVEFDPSEGGDDGDSAHDLTMEGGHSARRILHSGDMTGAEIQRALLASLAAHPSVTLFEHHVAIDLVTERKVRRHLAKRRLGLMGREVELRYGPGGPEGWMPGQGDRCLGAYVLDEKSGDVRVFAARVTLLATGGAGK
ncbi:MAG: FAD-binding protein, partial [Myxococcota bacterium]|nr:FAD-binding protein [Myxococcota bacterium]